MPNTEKSMSFNRGKEVKYTPRQKTCHPLRFFNSSSKIYILGDQFTSWLFNPNCYGNFKPFLRSVSCSVQFLRPFSSRWFRILPRRKKSCDKIYSHFKMAVEFTISFEKGWGKFLWVIIYLLLNLSMKKRSVSILILKIVWSWNPRRNKGKLCNL